MGLRFGGVFTLLFLFLLPIVTVFLSWHHINYENWQHLIETQLFTLSMNTIKLMIGVGFGVCFLGVSTAWVVSIYEFKGRSLFEWMLILPLAIPAYVLAFIYVGLFDYSGEVPIFLRENLGTGFALPEIRSSGGVIMTFSFAFYPYVYLLARSAFARQGRDMLDSARCLGFSALGGFFKVALPLARPAIVAGIMLALMETLADFGAVSIFNYDTFTTAIYKTWRGFFDINTAAQLATLLLGFLFLLLILERFMRGKAQFHQQVVERQPQRYILNRWQTILVVSCFMVLLILAFFIPVAQLFYWVFLGSKKYVSDHLVSFFFNSVALSFIAAIIVLIISVVFVQLDRTKKRWLSAAIRVACLGYALPGSVLAVGIVMVLAGLNHQLIEPIQRIFGLSQQQLLLGSVFGLLFAYVMRFLAIGFSTLDASVSSIKPILADVAKTLGVNSAQIWRRVYFPQLLPGFLTAILLVFIEVMKEMPATLLLRPFGWDTLSIKIYELTSEGQWQEAALPALLLISVGLLGVILIVRQMRFR